VWHEGESDPLRNSNVHAVASDIVQRFWPDEAECPWNGWEAGLRDVRRRARSASERTVGRCVGRTVGGEGGGLAAARAETRAPAREKDGVWGGPPAAART